MIKDLSYSEDAVIENRRQYAEHWRDKPDSYWLMRLMQEVCELAQSLEGKYEHPPGHELKQIAGICINWHEHRRNQPL